MLSYLLNNEVEVIYTIQRVSEAGLVLTVYAMLLSGARRSSLPGPLSADFGFSTTPVSRRFDEVSTFLSK